MYLLNYDLESVCCPEAYEIDASQQNTVQKSHYPPGNHHARFIRWCLGDNQSVGSSVLLVSRWL